MISFLGSLPEWFIVVFIWLFLGFIMYSGYLMGRDSGIHDGYKAGYESGKVFGRREGANRL